MAGRAEVVDLVSGRGVLDVCASGSASALAVGGRPVACVWDDREGSVAQYLARAGVADIDADLAAYRAAVDGGWDPDRPAAGQLVPLLELFAPGRYELARRPGGRAVRRLGSGAAWDFASSFDQFYPSAAMHGDGCDVVLTRPAESVDAARVAHFRDRIAAGVRPVAVTAAAKDAWCEFVVDGHHKLLAYAAAGVPPAVVCVVRLDPRPVPADAVDPGHPLAAHFRQVAA